VSIETFLENCPVLVVAQLSAAMFISARQDYSSKGSVGPFNYSLWLGALVPLGWACALANRPWQLTSMITVLVVYCACALKQFLPLKSHELERKETPE
jgi:hypothetical protein